jgi:hypothetical protein
MPEKTEPPVVGLQMDAKRASRVAWTAVIFGALAIVANGITAMGFLPVKVMQLAAGCAAIFAGLSYHFARLAPPTTGQMGGTREPR